MECLHFLMEHHIVGKVVFRTLKRPHFHFSPSPIYHDNKRCRCAFKPDIIQVVFRLLNCLNPANFLIKEILGWNDYWLVHQKWNSWVSDPKKVNKVKQMEYTLGVATCYIGVSWKISCARKVIRIVFLFLVHRDTRFQRRIFQQTT